MDIRIHSDQEFRFNNKMYSIYDVVSIKLYDDTIAELQLNDGSIVRNIKLK